MAEEAIEFVVHGKRELREDPERANRGERVLVGALRGAGDSIKLRARPGTDVVVLRLANGPELVLHPESAKELLQSQAGMGQRRSDGQPDGAVEVPARLSWGALAPSAGTRSGIGDVLIDLFEVVAEPAAQAIAGALGAAVDAQVPAGLRQLAPGALAKEAPPLADAPAVPAGAPMLVLLHGTFSHTAATFGHLWSRHPTKVAQLFERYDGRVFGFDHPTLCESPIRNALALTRHLPHGAVLHLLTHSRGGLIAEVLARACAEPALDEEALSGFGDEQREALRELTAQLRQKQVRVERVVRVACPARGTTLAGKRLDAYVSVLKWALQLSGIPVASEIVGFLHEVAKLRSDEALLPGLSAMAPDSPLVQWLHAGDDSVPGELRVIAGDVEGDSIWSWTKTLMADAFYWTDNDFVVPTRAMYGGARRQPGSARFFLDQGSNVSHFGYFGNESTAQAVADALLEDQPAQFLPVGVQSYSGKDSSGVRGSGPDPTLPAVFVLPGILGSNLKHEGKRIWLGPRFINGFARLSWKEGTEVEPDGVLSSYYEELVEFLSARHEVIPFAFDWRRPLEDEARRLAKALDAAIQAREHTQKPVRIIAHSMGGLLARTVELEKPEVWRRFIEREGARFVMLGTPNGGSWVPMRVLTGDDDFGNWLAFAGTLFGGAASRKLMAGLPGFLQLQAGLQSGAKPLAVREHWEKLAEDDLAYERLNSRWHVFDRDQSGWGIPPREILARASALRTRLDRQRDHFSSHDGRVLLVLGKDEWTPCGYRECTSGIEYEEVNDAGDGTVTHESAMLPGVPTFQLDAIHGDLPRTEHAFEALEKLLVEGTAQEPLRVFSAATRAAREEARPPVVRRVRPSREAGVLSQPVAERPGITNRRAERPGRAATGQPSLRVAVTHGHLKFVGEPLVVGHYRSMALTGAEKAMNRLIGGSMAQALAAGNYPEELESHQIFTNRHADPDNPWRTPRPQAVIVVGLGEEGELDIRKLSRSVEKAVLGYAQRLIEAPKSRSTFELATTLLGSGGSGISVAISAQAIVRGVRDANVQLMNVGWPVVARLSIVEVYQDRAAEAWRSLDGLRRVWPGALELGQQIEVGTGGFPRPAESGYRGADYDFVTVVREPERAGVAKIAYTLDTRRARTEARGQATQGELVKQLVQGAADHRARNPALSLSLFRLLVPVELEPLLTGADSLVLQLDSATAQIPWEVLDVSNAENQGGERELPWAIRGRLIRKLRTESYRERVVGAGRRGGVLVIGAPKTSEDFPKLPAAMREAEAVATAFARRAAAGEAPPELLVEKGGLAVLTTLVGAPYRVVHIAGHGALATKKQVAGVVLDGDLRLSAAEIHGMRQVPELVFVNCCHLGQIGSRDPLAGKRPEFAAGVARALIDIGVRCVVAAGWAVDDAAAECFATSFYQAVLENRPFVEAVTLAREATWRSFPHTNTWGAYQCYGDPDWRYDQHDVAESRESDGPIISAAGLLNALETATTRLKCHTDAVEVQLAWVARLERDYARRWGEQGDVAQAFANAYAEANALDDAIRWYSRAVSLRDGLASLHAIRQLANLRARRAEERVELAARDLPDGPERTANEAWSKLVSDAEREVEGAIDSLETLDALLQGDGEYRVELLSLIASAYKRLSLIKRHAHPSEVPALVAKVVDYYAKAEELATARKSKDLYYPALNGMAARLLARLHGASLVELDASQVATIHQHLKECMKREPEFWPAVSVVELKTYEALANRSLATAMSGISAELALLQQRVAAPRYWATVRDQARFYLQHYRSGALPEEELRAARELMSLLESYAPLRPVEKG